MLFFKTKPDIADHDKARLEFRLQQITDQVGSERMRLPIQESDQLIPSNPDAKPQSVVEILRNHLQHDFDGFKVQESLDVVEQKSGGGG